MLFMVRTLRLRLDLLKPDIYQHVKQKLCYSSQLQKKLRTCDTGQCVFARGNHSPTQKLQFGETQSQTGPILIHREYAA